MDSHSTSECASLYSSSNTRRSSMSSQTSSEADSKYAAKDTQRVKQINVRTICFVGAGYVGGPTAAMIAEHNPHIRVTVVDKSAARIAQWNSRHLPVHEPGLYDMVRRSRDGLKNKLSGRSPNLFFSTNIEQNLSEADLIFLSVNTPTKTSGIGAGKATDMGAFESATSTVAQYAAPGAIIVEKSTVPVRTAEMIRDILRVHRPDESFEVLSNPEFLAEGTAIKDLQKPDRVLIGSRPTKEGRKAAAALAAVYESWIDSSRILLTNIWSSELTKLTANAMLAQRISSINSISAICERIGADVHEVGRAVGLDNRIGPQFLKAGIGFGGSCFKKDILSLTYLARSLELPEVARYWEQVLTMNDFQRDRFVHRVMDKLNGTLSMKKVAVLGYAFKKDTNDSRESPAIGVVEQLLLERPREIAVFDPQCSSSKIKSELSHFCGGSSITKEDGGPVEAYDKAYDALQGASAVIILTDWDQFRYPPLNPNATSSEKANDKYAKDGDSEAEDFESDSLDLNDEPPCPSDCIECSRSSSEVAGIATNIDWTTVKDLMLQPRLVFDGRGVVDVDQMEALGYRVESIGRSSNPPKEAKIVRPNLLRSTTAPR